MLDWLMRIFTRTPERAAAPARRHFGVRVDCDPDVISLTRAGAPREVITWAEVASVGLVSGDADSEPPELCWLLQGRDRRRALLVPMGAPGEHEFVQAMQARLHGFDNMAVVEAMSATGSVGFKVWDAEWARAVGNE
jgi:hypothetical protein